MEINPVLEVENAGAEYCGREVLKGISLRMNAGERIALIGPSGCGKTTLLNLIAGLLPLRSGKMIFNGQPIVGPSRARVVIFQNHALFPWLTARENIEFALQDAAGADGFLAQVGLSESAGRYPHQLSGGMQQRVGIARALAVNPGLLLLDEPFASLDVVNREAVLKDLNGTPRRSLILVTHDIEEAIFLADKIYLMSGSPGRVIRTIQADFKKPATVLETKRLGEFARIENEIHEHLLRHP